MKVIVFSAETFERDDLDKMNEKQLMETAKQHPDDCEIYDSLAGFQGDFNWGYVSYETFIYFVNL